ncbi:MAG: hypothetical protein ACE14V_13280 [bacterium]
MQAVKVEGLKIAFPILASRHEVCPYNPTCSPQIMESLLKRLSPKLKTAIKYLLQHHFEPTFTIMKLTDEFGHSQRYFERLFLKELGSTPKECLSQIRICHYHKQRHEWQYRRPFEAYTKAGFNSSGSFEYAHKKYPLLKTSFNSNQPTSRKIPLF